jgi:hypothetical protein
MQKVLVILRQYSGNSFGEGRAGIPWIMDLIGTSVNDDNGKNINTSELFVRQLRAMSPTDTAAAESDPSRLVIPLCQFSASDALNDLCSLEKTMLKYKPISFPAAWEVEELSGEIASLNRSVFSIRYNRDMVKAFYRNSNDSECKAVVQDFEEILTRSEQTTKVLLAQLNFTTMLASLDGSRLSVVGRIAC